MEIDLAEYDQMDEFALIMGNQEQIYPTDGSSSKFVVTLSSCSDQTSSHEEANCENDFVFLPALPGSVGAPPSNQQSAARQLAHSNQLAATKAPPDLSAIKNVPTDSTKQVVASVAHPLTVISNNNNNNGGNPFYPRSTSTELATIANGQQPFTPCRPVQPPQQVITTEACVPGKPIGPLDVSPSLANNPVKLAELMQQIVTRSDLIYIAIPCALCQEPVACPPSDISSWLNHMSRHHNCKVCPVCNKLIGLGPKQNVEIMRRHVVEHFDDDWLERRASKVSFTFGLQQQWFLANRCSVKDQRNR